MSGGWCRPRGLAGEVSARALGQVPHCLTEASAAKLHATPTDTIDVLFTHYDIGRLNISTLEGGASHEGFGVLVSGPPGRKTTAVA